MHADEPVEAVTAVDDPYAVTDAAASGQVAPADPIDMLIARQRWLRLAMVATPLAWVLAWSVRWEALVASPSGAVFVAPWLVGLLGFAWVAAAGSARVAWLTGVERSRGIALAVVAWVPLLGLGTMAWLHVRANRALRAQGFRTRWHGPLF